MPISGMLPVVVFFILACFLPFTSSLIGSVVTFALFFLIVVVILKYHPPITLLVSIIVFLLLAGLSLIKPVGVIYLKQSSVMLEILTVLVFSIFLFVKNFFRAKIVRKNDVTKDFRLVRFDADIYVMRFAAYNLCFHLLIVLIYQLFPAQYHTPVADKVIYFIILYLLIIGHFTFEFVRFHQLRKQLADEEWLPIVNESGAVQGKIAWSVSKNLGNKYLHPLIRIAVIHKGMVYLKERPMYFISQKGKLDYPFETYLRFHETLNESVERTYRKAGIMDEVPTRFIFRYVSDSIETNRLIYLYACVINKDRDIRDLHLEGGKFWTSKQIEENINTGLFSDYFEKEYELLNNTVLLADKIMNNLNDPLTIDEKE